MLLTIVSFLLLLGVLMFFHELGHYWVARRNGIEVEEFGVFGFPPRIVKLFTYKGTDFTLNAIPLGAFVRMKGEDMGDMAPGSFNAASARARAAVLIAGPAMNLLLAVVFSVAATLSGFPASVSNPQVDGVVAQSVAAEVGLQPGDVLLSLRGEPLFVGSVERDILRAGVGTDASLPQDLAILRNGEYQILPVDGNVSAQALLASIQSEPVLTTRITAVVDETPAAEAGLQADDLVYAVNGERVTLTNPLSLLVAQYPDEYVTLTILRQNQLMDVDVLARANPPEGQGSMGIGIDGRPVMANLPFVQAVQQGVLGIVDYLRMVASLPVMLIAGQIAPEDAGVAGPVGIAQLVGGAVNATASTGFWFPVWQLAAIISAGLAIANLLPIPALDGGRLLFILFEKLRGRRLDPEFEGTIHLVGFALLLGLMVVVTISDIRSGPQLIDWSRLLGQ
jgi:regulator of sigma E protease